MQIDSQAIYVRWLRNEGKRKGSRDDCWWHFYRCTRECYRSPLPFSSDTLALFYRLQVATLFSSLYLSNYFCIHLFLLSMNGTNGNKYRKDKKFRLDRLTYFPTNFHSFPIASNFSWTRFVTITLTFRSFQIREWSIEHHESSNLPIGLNRSIGGLFVGRFLILEHKGYKDLNREY